MREGNGVDVMRIVYRIRLRVEIPGREPYDAKVGFAVPPWASPPAPGETVAVTVAAANPRKVRIDIGRQPSTRVGFFGTTPQGDPANPMKFPINLQPSVAQVAEQFRQSNGAGGGLVHSAAALLATGQRAMGAIKSFAPTGTTSRSLGRTTSRPELLDAPLYSLVVELHFPNLAPMEARTVQPVPPAQVPSLAIGLPLPCAVDPANPQLCVVDWDAISH